VLLQLRLQALMRPAPLLLPQPLLQEALRQAVLLLQLPLLPQPPQLVPLQEHLPQVQLHYQPMKNPVEPVLMADEGRGLLLHLFSVTLLSKVFNLLHCKLNLFIHHDYLLLFTGYFKFTF